MRVEIPAQYRVIAHYTEDAQALIHMEECGELIQAVSKMRRVRNSGGDDTDAYDNLVEEMADVLICLEQLKETYGISDTEIQAMLDRKWKRQEERLHDADRRLHQG